MIVFGRLDGDQITLLEDVDLPEGPDDPGLPGRSIARRHLSYPGAGPLAPSIHPEADVLVIRSPLDAPLAPHWLAIDIEFGVFVDAAGAYPISPQRTWFDEFLESGDFQLDFRNELPDEAWLGRTSLPVYFDLDAPEGLRLDGLGCLPFPAPPTVVDDLPSLLELYVQVDDDWRPAAEFGLALESEAGPGGANCTWRIRPALGGAMPDAPLMLGVVGIYEPTVLTVTPL